MKMMSYFKKHFVTRVRNFVFTYRKSIERKCHTTVINKNGQNIESNDGENIEPIMEQIFYRVIRLHKKLSEIWCNDSYGINLVLET